MRIFVTMAALLLSSAAASPLAKRSVKFNWGSTPVLGVNIGGWLVLEPWITPSIFQQFEGHETVDEYTLCQNHASQAPGILKKHWDSWVSLDDFKKIQSAGFNMVRIPVGYWAYQKLDNDPYVTGAAVYIDKAIGWARQTGLKVLIDLHGAPLSQNGFDNSGHNGTAGWGSDSTSVPDTRAVIQKIANKYAQDDYQDVVVGIELLNEPLPDKLSGGTDVVVQYSKDGYGDVRDISDTPVVIQDAFQQGSFWDDILTSPDAQGVVIDHHEYQVFTDELVALSADGHVQKVCSNVGTYTSKSHWVIVGEWSAAMTDCAAALNGYGVGSRFEGSYFGDKGSTGRSCGDINFIETWNSSLIENTKRYIEAQLDVFTQQTNGFIFWNFKTEASPEWDLFRLLDKNIFPNLKNRKPTSACSS